MKYFDAAFILLLAGLILGWDARGEAGDLRVALRRQNQLARFYDKLNLKEAELYRDCACHTLKKRHRGSLSHSLCGSESENTSIFSVAKYNFRGDLIRLSVACEQKIEFLLKDTNRKMNQMRQHLALSRNGLEPSTVSYPLLGENLSMIRDRNDVAINTEIERPLGLPGSALEPLDAQEAAKAVHSYQRESKEIFEDFLASPEFDLAFGAVGIDHEDLESLLSMGSASAQKRIAETLERVCLTGGSNPQVLSVNYLFSMYARFAGERRRSLRDAHLRSYFEIVNGLPVLQNIGGRKVDIAAFLDGLGPVLINAKSRVQSGRDVIGLKAVDNPLALLNLSTVLEKQENWTEERAARAIKALIKKRSAQIERESVGEFALTLAAFGSCMLVSRFVPASQVAAKLIAPQLCTLAMTIAVDAYFMYDFVARRTELIEGWMSSADGFNQIHTFDEILSSNSEAQLMWAFYVFDAASALQILKYFSRNKF